MSRSRAYCFTINNYTEDDVCQVKALAEIASYVVVGKEVGENSTPHLQGYVYFKEAKTFTSVKKKITRAHLELTKGSPEDNRRYCTKDGDVLLEHGVPPRQGNRNDIQQVVEGLKDGDNMRAVIEKAKSVQSIKVAEVWLKYNEVKRDWKPEVRWYYGKTGTGKTRTAREWLGEDIYTCLDTIKWMEGYDQHENVLIDDMRKDFAKFHQLLKLLDRYDYKVETKGGSRQFLARKIAITAPMRPEHMFQTREDVQQLLRRIDEIIQIGPDLSEIESDVD